MYEKLRIAAYIRVSTKDELQLDSYENQRKHYLQLIENNTDWELVGIYGDKGKSGLSYKNRNGFNRLIQDCKSGGIDVIITKSMSRFSRNIVDMLVVIRLLKSLNIDVLFEDRNLLLSENTTELLLTILSTIYQEESFSKSKDIKWGFVKAIEHGSYSPKCVFGYYKKKGRFMIIEKDAKVVRIIFEMYLDGYSLKQIKEFLETKNYQTSSGKNQWSTSVIDYMLSNEKYTGDIKLQKTYSYNFPDIKRKVNNGEENGYIYKNNHKPIIEKEIFNKVQTEKINRKGRKYSSHYLTNILRCGCCGSRLKRITYTNYKPKKVVYKCMNKIDKNEKTKCNFSKIEEEKLLEAIESIMKSKISEDKDFQSNLVLMIGNCLYLDTSEFKRVDDCEMTKIDYSKVSDVEYLNSIFSNIDEIKADYLKNNLAKYFETIIRKSIKTVTNDNYLCIIIDFVEL